MQGIGRLRRLRSCRPNLPDDSSLHPNVCLVSGLSEHQGRSLLDVDGENFALEFVAKRGLNFDLSAYEEVHDRKFNAEVPS